MSESTAETIRRIYSTWHARGKVLDTFKETQERASVLLGMLAGDVGDLLHAMRTEGQPTAESVKELTMTIIRQRAAGIHEDPPTTGSR